MKDSDKEYRPPSNNNPVTGRGLRRDVVPEYVCGCNDPVCARTPFLIPPSSFPHPPPAHSSSNSRPSPPPRASSLPPPPLNVSVPPPSVPSNPPPRASSIPSSRDGFNVTTPLDSIQQASFESSQQAHLQAPHPQHRATQNSRAFQGQRPQSSQIPLDVSQQVYVPISAPFVCHPLMMPGSSGWYPGSMAHLPQSAVHGSFSAMPEVVDLSEQTRYFVFTPPAQMPAPTHYCPTLFDDLSGAAGFPVDLSRLSLNSPFYPIVSAAGDVQMMSAPPNIQCSMYQPVSVSGYVAPPNQPRREPVAPRIARSVASRVPLYRPIRPQPSNLASINAAGRLARAMYNRESSRGVVAVEVGAESSESNTSERSGGSSSAATTNAESDESGISSDMPTSTSTN